MAGVQGEGVSSYTYANLRGQLPWTRYTAMMENLLSRSFTLLISDSDSILSRLARAVTSSTALLVDTVQNKQQGAPQRTTVRSLSVHCLSSGRNNLQHPYDVTDINNNHNKSETMHEFVPTI